MRGSEVSNGIKRAVDELETYNDTMCKVEITCHYATQYFEIRFDRRFDPTDLITNVHLRLSTIILPSNGKNPDIVNTLQFACDNKDACDRLFFFDHIDWLLNIEYCELTNYIRPLIILGTRSVLCIVDDGHNLMAASCRACAWRYSSITKQNEATCYNGNLARIDFSVVTHLMLAKEYQYKQVDDDKNKNKQTIAEISRIIEYLCKPNWCTNGSSVQRINAVVQKYYPLWPIYQVFNINNGMKSEEPNTSEASNILNNEYASTMSKPTKTTSKSISTEWKPTARVQEPTTVVSEPIVATTVATTTKAKPNTSTLESITIAPEVTTITSGQTTITLESTSTVLESITIEPNPTSTTQMTKPVTTINISTISRSTHIKISDSTVNSESFTSTEQENKNTGNLLNISMNLMLMSILMFTFFKLLF